MIWISGLFALISLLAVFKAPAKPVWFVAIAATEWGHYLAIGCIVLALFIWRRDQRWGSASWLAMGAAILFITPLLRAMRLADHLPEQLVAHFGPVSPREESQAPARIKPLDFADLFRGIYSPAVRLTTLVYATVNGQPLSLDLYQPSKKGLPMPGIIVVHGGSWKSGRREELSDLNRYLAARGYLVASVDYRLAPQATFPAQRDDVFSAIAYLKNHAAEIGLDKNRLVLLGRSAGGQVALSAAYTGKDPAIKGVIAFYTPNDLAWGYSLPANPLIMNSRRVIEDYLGGPPAGRAVQYEAASPLNFVNKTTPPTLMIHGARDELVSPLHEDRLLKRLAEEGRPYFYLRLPWATHGCDANFSGPCGQLSTYAIERFLAAVL